MAGVVPPPVHGQSLITRALFDARLEGIEKVLVEIRSSKDIKEVGRPSLGKFLSVFAVIGSIVKKAVRLRPDLFYYTAGSGAWVPFIRDVLILGICRPFFPQVAIHYHSGNLVDFLSRSLLATKLGAWIYGRGAWSIRLGEGCPVPGAEMGVGRVIDVPNGIEAPAEIPPKAESESFRVLFLGNLFEDKGVGELIEAVGKLARIRDRPIELKLVGAWPDEETRTRCEAGLRALPAHVHVPTPGPAYGEEKWRHLRGADVLVLPTFYRRENVPLVIIEAMAAGLPVVATAWRGVRSLVEPDQTGILVPLHDTDALAAALRRLAESPEWAKELGKAGSLRFEMDLTLDAHLARMSSVLRQAAGRAPEPEPESPQHRSS